MRGFLKKLTGFTGLAAVIYLGVIAVMANTLQPVLYNGRPVTNVPLNQPDGGLTVLRFREADAFGPVDVLFMGSSHCYRTFDTAWYAAQGVRTFNLGSSAQGPLITRHLASRYLDQLDPQLVVLEVYSETLKSNSAESLLDQLANRPLDSDLVRMTAAVGGVKAWNALLVQALRFTGEPVESREPEYEPANGHYVSGGFVRRDGHSGGLPAYEGSPTSLNGKQLDSLGKLIETVQGQGRKIVLVGQPLPAATLAAITDYVDIQNTVAAVAAAHNVPFYDFNGLVKKAGSRDLHDPALFYDYHHYNGDGVAAFNPVFLELLRRDGWLP